MQSLPLFSCLGGVLFDVLTRKQIVLTIFNFCAALTILGIPWSRSITVLIVLMAGNGLSLGILDTGGNVCCLNLWGKDSGPFYQALHFTFGLGALIAPLIAAPFLGDYESETLEFDLKNSSTIFNNTTIQNRNSSLDTISEIPHVTYAFTIIGGFALFVTVLFLIVCIIAPIDNQGQTTDETQIRKRKLGFILLIVLLNVVLVFVETGTEVGYAQMLATYVVKGPLKLTSTTGSYMTSVFWGAFSVARFVSVFVAIKFSCLQMIIFDVIISLIGALILLFFGASEVWAVWLGTILLGVGIASFFPSAIGWVERYITVTNKIASSFAIGAAFGGMVIPYIISHYIDTIPKVILYVVTMSCVMSTVIVFIMWLILRKKQDKYLKDEGTTNVAFDLKVKE
ncbi:sodium-dependent glucose transporter 1 [Caerostris darwini]|uniref:Sodium-dependent glucose transporter 1 n=1 Tax=Caerostris darwini TaxID=1538125 RepID=A0AAV4WRV4_9ARAC|nr:sodium-dependent glucose transporter 1 [Caerostris darwini]